MRRSEKPVIVIECQNKRCKNPSAFEDSPLWFFKDSLISPSTFILQDRSLLQVIQVYFPTLNFPTSVNPTAFPTFCKGYIVISNRYNSFGKFDWILFPSMTLGDVPENLRKIKIMTRYSGFCFRKWRWVISRGDTVILIKKILLGFFWKMLQRGLRGRQYIRKIKLIPWRLCSG